MEPRKKRGNTLSLIVTAALVIVVIGLGIDFLLMVFKENRLLVNNSDSLALLVARDAAHYPNIELNAGFEEDALKHLLKDSKVDLKSYNKLLAQVLLVAANAAADGGAESVSQANQLIDAVQAPNPATTAVDANADPSMSIGARLIIAFRQATKDYSSGGYINACAPSSIFQPAVAGRRQYGRPDSGRYSIYANGASLPGKAALIKDMVGWVGQGEASNVVSDNISLPFVDGDTANPITIATASVSHNGQNFLPGYLPITFNGGASSQIKPFMLMSILVGEQPHLISTKTFEADKNPGFLGTFSVPPNAFKFVAATRDKKGNTNYMISAGRTGVLDTIYLPSMEGGYLEVINMGDIGSYDYDGSGTQTTNVYSKELMEGIWLADNGAFSTNRDAILGWAAYNRGDSTTPPPQYDDNGNLVVHGNTSTIQGLKGASSGARGSGPCMWIHVTEGDPNYIDNDCSSKLGEFEGAYPPGSLVAGDPTSYMAVEKFKQTVRTAFNTCGSYGCPAQSTGLRVFTDGWPGMAPDGVPDGRPAREMVNPVPSGGNSKISRAGTIVEMLNQVDPDKAGSVITELKQRMKQIDPQISSDQMNALLNSKRFELGEVAYIHKDGSGSLVLDNTKPQAMAGDVSNINDDRRKPVGTPKTLSSSYATIGTMVNPQREQAIHYQLYTSFPDPERIARGLDIAEWTRGIGVNNNLGRLRFKNQCGGTNPSDGTVMSATGSFCQPD